MKKLTGILRVLVPALFISLSASGQSDTLVTYSIDGSPTKKVDKATSIHKVFVKGGAWVRTTSDKDLVIQKSETFSDRDLKTLNGKYVEYENGNVRLKGYYLNNQKIGAWIKYDSLRRATRSELFLTNRKNGPYYLYWENGSVKEQGLYINGERNGDRKIFYDNGNLALKEVYDLESRLIDSAYFTIDGKPTIRDSILSFPQFPGGEKRFFDYIGSSLRYPEKAFKTTTEGKVYVAFDVNEIGELEDIEIISMPDKILGEEVVRVLKRSRKWIPGTILQKPATIRCKMNVNFILNYLN